MPIKEIALACLTQLEYESRDTTRLERWRPYRANLRSLVSLVFLTGSVLIWFVASAHNDHGLNDHAMLFGFRAHQTVCVLVWLGLILAAFGAAVALWTPRGRRVDGMVPGFAILLFALNGYAVFTFSVYPLYPYEKL